MKKFFAIAVIAVSIVACNNSGKEKEETKDTMKVETPMVNPPATNDSMPGHDSMMPMTKDSTKM